MFTLTNANKLPFGNSSNPIGVFTPNSVLMIKNCWICISANSFFASCSKLKAVSLLFNTILSANCSIVSLLNLTKNSLPFMLRYIGKSATIKAPANILLSSLCVLNS